MNFYREIEQTVDEIFEWAHSPDFENMGKMEFARYAQLSYSTLYALRKRRTRDPRYSTILKLFKAVGIPHDALKRELERKSTKKRRVYSKKMPPIIKMRRRTG
jgi:predicted transcriptional regulator